MKSLTGILIALVNSLGLAIAAPLPHIVAIDDLGTPAGGARVLSGAVWTMPTTVIADDHSIVFAAEEIILGYNALVAGADYEIELTFASDSPDRKVRVMAGDIVLDPELALPLNAEIRKTYQLPASVAAAGCFKLRILKLSGGNVVMSAATVRSNNQRMLGVPPVELPEVTLTPQPQSATGGVQRTVSLDGAWRFQEFAPADPAVLTADAVAPWSSIAVPGQWRNQGHDISATQTAAYATTFDRPAGWQDSLVKIRFDGVFSQCTVYLNGRKLGGHLGGFTPFEFDLTEFMRERANLLVLSVTSDSLADQMASASKYACHALGGISRSVTLLSVPAVHLSDFVVRTDFDRAYHDATLEVAVEVDASHATGPGAADVGITLRDPSGAVVALSNSNHRVAWSQPGRIRQEFTFAVPAARWWTPETPACYVLEITCGGHLVRQNVGFRKIEVQGTRVLVNGRPLKLRGVNRHETDPLRGRSLAPGQWRKDAQLFRDANVNLIRTSHYPPDHQLIEEADELGIWIEVESPFCWEGDSNNPAHRDATLRQVAEMIKRDRNNPSVLYWSLGNESAWGNNFELSSRMVRQLDPTRPQTFEWMSNSINDADAGQCEIGVVHYPGINGPVLAKTQAKRPLFVGEYCHLNAYNRRELMTDPGLRDRWGLYLHRIWEQMDAEPNILGGAIWAGIDDTFFPAPDLTLGYGAWGPLDGWRRPKPEYWHVKKTYSPVRVDEDKPLVLTDGKLSIEIENRSDFINLSEIEARWKIGTDSGVARADIPARSRGQLVITPAHAPAAGQSLELSFADPRGFETNRFVLAVGPPASPAAGPAPAAAARLATTAQTYQITSGAAVWSIDRRTGTLDIRAGGTPVVTAGPHLMLIPNNSEGETQMTGPTKIHDAFSPVCSQWQCRQVMAEATAAGPIKVTIQGAYAEAEGSYTLTFLPAGVEFSYNFKINQAVDPRQTGVAFDLPAGFDRLQWTRRGLWTTYPDDHVGRTTGEALATTADGKPAIEIGPRDNPGNSPWSHDNTRYGSNDFRSTKENILSASLGRAGGGSTFAVNSDGGQSVRAWLDPATRQSGLLVANYTSGGSERFLGGLSAPDKRPLKPGDTVTASFHLNILPP
jgi:hypothetical protein